MKTFLALFVFILSSVGHANVVGVDTQNFNPINDGLDFVTVHSSKTLRPGLLNIGFFLNYAVNSLPNYENTKTQSRTNFRDSLLSSDTNFALGLTRSWEVGLSMPVLLAQKVSSDTSTVGGEFASTGITEYRMMTKYHIAGGHRGGLAGVFTVNLNQIQNDPFTGVGSGPTYNLELVADTALAGGFALGFNAGYRLRNPGTPIANIPVQPLGNQYIASTALSYFVSSWRSKFIGEVFGSYPAQKQQFSSDRSSSTAEALLGIKVDVTRRVAFHFGGGSEIIHGTSSPDWRVYTGINWVIGPLFDKPRPAIAKVTRKQPVVKALDLMDGSDPFVGPPQPKESFVASDVLFEFDQDVIKPEFTELMGRLVKYLLQPPVFKSLVIEGHTDAIGDPVYNLDLSKRRAENVRAKLISMGLAAERIIALGFGASHPVASNGNFQGRALNRRVEFKVER